MKRRTEFYKTEDQISRTQKQRIWEGIEFQLDASRVKPHFEFDWKNYALGVATCVILILAGVGLRTILFENQLAKQSELSMLNTTYSDAISQLEKIATKKLSTNRVQNLDELLQAKGEQLNSVTKAIVEIIDNKELSEFESIKDKRLRQLYLMKLEILDEIIAIQGGVK